MVHLVVIGCLLLILWLRARCIEWGIMRTVFAHRGRRRSKGLLGMASAVYMRGPLVLTLAMSWLEVSFAGGQWI